MAISPLAYQNQPSFNVAQPAAQKPMLDPVIEGLKSQDEKQKAAAFQQWVSKGIEGMAQVYNELPDDVKASVVPPDMIAGVQGKPEGQKLFLDWYGTVNAAINKKNQITAAQAGDYDALMAHRAAAPDATSADIEEMYGRKKFGQAMADYNPTVEEEIKTQRIGDAGSISDIIKQKESGGRLDVIHGLADTTEANGKFYDRLKDGGISLGMYGITPKFWFESAGLEMPKPEDFAALDAIEAKAPGTVKAAMMQKEFSKLPAELKAAFPKQYADFLQSQEMQDKAKASVLDDYIKKASRNGEFNVRDFAMLYATGGTNPDKVVHTDPDSGVKTTAKDYADDFEAKYNAMVESGQFQPWSVVEDQVKKSIRNKTRGEYVSEMYKKDQSKTFLNIVDKFASSLPVEKAFDPSAGEKAKLAADKLAAKTSENKNKAAAKEREFNSSQARLNLNSYMKDDDGKGAIEVAHKLKPVVDFLKDKKNVPGFGALQKPFSSLIQLSNQELKKAVGSVEADKISKFKVALDQALNAYIHKVSGKTVTANELPRILEGFGRGTFNTFEDFKNAVNSVFNDEYKKAKSSYDSRKSSWQYDYVVKPEGLYDPSSIKFEDVSSGTDAKSDEDKLVDRILQGLDKRKANQ